MSDKEVRFGIANTALWAVATTNASNGSVNGGHDALTASGGAVPLVNMFFGEVIFGGVGSGLYGMFFYIVIAVFVAGLMVGPYARMAGQEDRGARDQDRGDRGALRADDGADADRARGRHHRRARVDLQHRRRTASPRRSTPTTRSRTTTAAPSPATARRTSPPRSARSRSTSGRFVPLIAALALGGALAAKKIDPASAGTFRTDGPTFVVLLVGVIVLTAGLMIFPALTLGPIVEGLMPDAALDRLVGHRRRRLHARVRLRLPGADDRLRRGRLLGQGERQPDRAGRQGRRLAARRAGVQEPALLPRAPLGDGAAPTTRARTTFANLGPTNPDLAKNVRGRGRAILRLERPYNPGLTIGDIPVDAVTTSGSGIDPHISPAYAELQAPRIAAVRGLPLDTRRSS